MEISGDAKMLPVISQSLVQIVFLKVYRKHVKFLYYILTTAHRRTGKFFLGG